MQHLNISERLMRISTYLPKGAVFADIGSDHAYLPCYVCRNDHHAHAIAGELNEGPYLRALQNVQSHGLENQIDVRLGNGLHILFPDEVKQIVLSGMGAELMCDILLEGMDKLHTCDRIIVQPNIESSKLRRFLVQNQYELTAEELIEEKGHFYEIIVADKKKHTHHLTEKELLFGPFLLQGKSPLFYRKWTYEYAKRQKIAVQMKKANNLEQKLNQISKELSWIEEVLENERNT